MAERPPPANTILTLSSPNQNHNSDVACAHDDSQRDESENQRRAAITEERKRDAGDRKDADDDADIDRDLDGETHGNPQNQEAEKIVFDGQSDQEASVKITK